MLITFVVFISHQKLFSDDLGIEDLMNQSWRWSEFDLTFGQKSNDILDIIESDEVVWAITNNGFAWFDNYKWHIIPDNISKYIKNPYNLYRIPNLIAGNKGDLVAVFNGGLTYISKSEIKNVKYNYKDKEIFIFDVAKYKNSYFVIASEYGKIKKNIYHLSAKKIETFPLPDDLSRQDSLYEMYFTNGSDGSVWINSSKGIYYLHNDKWLRVFKTDLSSVYDLSKPLLSSEQNYSFYIGFPIDKTGLWRYNVNDGAKLVDSLKITMLTSDVYKNGLIFNLYHGGKLECFLNNQWSEVKQTPQIIKNAVNIKFTKDGDLWVSHFKKIYLCKLSSDRWKYWIQTDTYKRQFINEIIKSKDSSYWIAYGDGVGRVKDGNLINFYGSIDNVNLEGVTALNEDKHGNIWIGSGGGFFKNTFKWDGTKWNYIRLLPEGQDVQVHKIRKDRKGRLWFLTLSGTSKEHGWGALVYDNNKVVEIWDMTKGLLSNRIYDFLEDDEGAYWFATYYGLSKYKDGKWKHWNTKNGLRADLIFCIALHPDGKTVYYSNVGEGVGLIKNDRPEFITQIDSLNILLVSSLSFEQNGNLWLGTKTGVYCLVENDALISFSHEQGLSSNYIWPILIDNNLVFIGTFGAGINILNLNERNLPAPEVEFSRTLDGNDINLIRLQISTYRGFSKPEDYYIRYRFDNGKWSGWQKRNLIDINNLSTGEHKLEVQLMYLLGNKFSKSYFYNFNIEKVFYQRVEFVLPISFLIFVIFIGLSYYHKKTKNQIKQLELSRKELAESELKYRYIVENTNDGLILSHDNQIQFFNQIISDLTGFTEQELSKKSLLDLVDRDYHNLLNEKFERYKTSEKISEKFEVRLITKSKELVWVEIRLNIIPTEDGSISILMMSDIEKRKKLEKKMLEAFQKEKELGDLKSSIISTISHEYRTPLTIMQTSADLLKINYQLRNDEKFNKNITRINDAISRMIKFLEDILLLGKIESRNIDLHFDEMDIRQFCNDIVSNVNARNERGHIINVEYDVSNHNIFIETTLLIEIINRLLSNAINYSPDNSNIDMNVSYHNKFLTVKIKDNGFGIDKDKLNKIFEPFYRVINSEANPGTGFGLTIVKGCVEALGGKITIDSKPYNGTLVEFIIPVKERMEIL